MEQNNSFKINKQWIKTNYDKYRNIFNQLSINLPSSSEILFDICHRYTAVGYCQFYRGNYSTFIIKLSDCFLLEEKQYLDVLLHEMIHGYLRVNRIKEVHGYIFKSIMNFLNKNYHFNVSLKFALNVKDITKTTNHNNNEKICIIKEINNNEFVKTYFFKLSNSLTIDAVKKEVDKYFPNDIYKKYDRKLVITNNFPFTFAIHKHRLGSFSLTSPKFRKEEIDIISNYINTSKCLIVNF